MIDERMEEEASLYALGALVVEEARAFEAVLSRNAELRQLVAELRRGTEAVALASSTLSPPPALKQRIMAQIRQKQDEDQHRQIIRLEPSASQGFPNWISWAAAACFALFAVLLWNRGQKLRLETQVLEAKVDAAARRDAADRQAAAELQKQIDAARADAAVLQDQVANARRREADARGFSSDLVKQVGSLTNELAALRQKYSVAQMRLALLTSLVESTPKAVAVSLWDNDKQEGVLVTENLSPLPSDKNYQLWVLDPKNPNAIDAGVFTVDEKGRVRFQFKPKEPVQVPDKFAITVEKKGGVEKPTLPPVLIGL
jgi:anti-sigma-K factor RskA